MSLRPLRLALLFSAALATLSAASVLPAGPAELARLRDAAERGDRTAQHGLGLVYADPAEPAYNPVEAYVWLTLAADNGTASKSLENLRANLTPAQLAAAQRLLATRNRAAPTLATTSPATAAPPEETSARLRAQLTAVELENERLRTQIAEQKMRLALREEDLAALGRQLGSASTDKASRPTTPAAAADQTAPNDPETARLRTERDRLQNQLASAEASRAAFQRQLDQATASLTAAQRELAARRDDSTAKALAAERDTLKERTAALQTQADQLTARLAASEQSRAALSRQLAASESARTEALRQLAETEAARAETARQNATATATTTQTATQLATLREQLAETETKLAAALRAFNLREEEFVHQQKAIVSLDEERAATATRLAAAEAARADLARQHAAATEALAQANAAPRPDPEVEALRARLAEFTRAETELAAARETLAERQEQLATLNATHARELDSLRTELREARAAQPAAVTAAPNLAAAEAVAPRVHTIAAGDTLGKIARQYYGASSRWPEIMEANRDRIKNPDVLPLGVRLVIP